MKSTRAKRGTHEAMLLKLCRTGSKEEREAARNKLSTLRSAKEKRRKKYADSKVCKTVTKDKTGTTIRSDTLNMNGTSKQVRRSRLDIKNIEGKDTLLPKRRKLTKVERFTQPFRGHSLTVEEVDEITKFIRLCCYHKEHGQLITESTDIPEFKIVCPEQNFVHTTLLEGGEFIFHSGSKFVTEDKPKVKEDLTTEDIYKESVKNFYKDYENYDGIVIIGDSSNCDISLIPKAVIEYGVIDIHYDHHRVEITINFSATTIKHTLYKEQFEYIYKAKFEKILGIKLPLSKPNS